MDNFITKTLTADIPDEVELADPDLDDFEDIKVTRLFDKINVPTLSLSIIKFQMFFKTHFSSFDIIV